MKKPINLAEEIERRESANKMAPFPPYDREVINDLKILNMITKQDDYNNVPVTYCKTCLSLHVKEIANPDVAYCVDCGNTDLEKAHIHEWEDLYEEKYGERFLNLKDKK